MSHHHHHITTPRHENQANDCINRRLGNRYVYISFCKLFNFIIIITDYKYHQGPNERAGDKETRAGFRDADASRAQRYVFLI
jgi:hypothetical protein